MQHDLPLTRPYREFLTNMRTYYKVPQVMSDADALPVLRRRLGVLPESLVLAQAAIESGWGSSRFARQANNLFGQWCYQAGCGLVPARRRAGATHEVRSFETIEAAIDAYYRNLNTNPVYKPVRDIRENADTSPSGLELAAGLELYSELGDAYIEKVRKLIRSNDLEAVTGEG
ncbi:MAG: glucosaminidase domain-containing protein [Pseudomonadota bacterium]